MSEDATLSGIKLLQDDSILEHDSTIINMGDNWKSAENAAETSIGSSIAVWNFPKLNGTVNWKQWNQRFILGLEYEGLDDVLTLEKVEAADERRNAKALILMKCMCEESPVDNISECKTAKSAYDILKGQYAESGSTAKYMLLTKLFRTTIHSPGIDGDVEAYISAHNQIRRDLKDLESSFPEWIFCAKLIYNLEDKYTDFVQRVCLEKDTPNWHTLTRQLREVAHYHAQNQTSQSFRARSTKNKGRKGKD